MLQAPPVALYLALTGRAARAGDALAELADLTRDPDPEDMT
jgi:hypothetical protein